MGQCGQWGIDVDEGDLSDIGLRTKWDVEVKNLVQARGDDRSARQEHKKEQAEETLADRLDKVLEFLKSKPDGVVATEIKEHIGCNDKAWKPIKEKLLGEECIVECKVKRKNGQTYDGFCLA